MLNVTRPPFNTFTIVSTGAGEVKVADLQSVRLDLSPNLPSNSDSHDESLMIRRSTPIVKAAIKSVLCTVTTLCKPANEKLTFDNEGEF